MTISPKTLIHHCLIGLKVKIVQSSNPQLINITGKIVDETKNTLMIQMGKKQKHIPKKDCLFHFFLSETLSVEIVGNLLIGRPEERIKKRFSYKWNN